MNPLALPIPLKHRVTQLRYISLQAVLTSLVLQAAVCHVGFSQASSTLDDDIELLVNKGAPAPEPGDTKWKKEFPEYLRYRDAFRDYLRGKPLEIEIQKTDILSSPVTYEFMYKNELNILSDDRSVRAPMIRVMLALAKNKKAYNREFATIKLQHLYTPSKPMANEIRQALTQIRTQEPEFAKSVFNLNEFRFEADDISELNHVEPSFFGSQSKHLTKLSLEARADSLRNRLRGALKTLQKGDLTEFICNYVDPVSIAEAASREGCRLKSRFE